MCGRPQFPTFSSARTGGTDAAAWSVPFRATGARRAPAADVAPPAPGRTVRVGDDERRDVDGVLAQAMSLGYLTFDEWRARSDRVLAATTTAELATVTADLPVAELVRRDPARIAARTAGVRREIRTRTLGWLALAALMIVIWLAVAVPTGAWYPWPVWPILGTGIGLVSHVLPARAQLRSS